MEGLGQEYSIDYVAFKIFPACWHMQSTLAAVSQVAREMHLDPSQVERIEVASVPYIENFADYEPVSAFDCQFSLPYTISMVLLDNPPGPAWFDPALRRDDRVRALAMKVYLDPHGWKGEVLPGQTPAAVHLILQDGRSYEAHFAVPPAEPARTISEETLIRKFRQLVTPLLGDEGAELALTWIQSLPDGEIGPGWLPKQVR